MHILFSSTAKNVGFLRDITKLTEVRQFEIWVTPSSPRVRFLDVESRALFTLPSTFYLYPKAFKSTLGYIAIVANDVL